MQRFLWEYLKEVKKPIVLYGMGNGADKIINVLKAEGIPFSGIFASDGFVRKKTFHGFEITTLKELEDRFGDLVILLCFGSERPEVLELIRSVAARHELYAPDVPVVGEGVFDREFVNKNLKRFERVYSLLQDDISRKTYEKVIRFKLSGDISLLFDCETHRNEPYENLLNIGKNEHFLDLGAYNGDTALEFAQRAEKYSLITAVEPDKKSFNKLIKNTEGLQNISLINAAVCDRKGKGLFDMKGGRNSAIGSIGVETDLVTVDSLTLPLPPTFIKMDLEGGEAAAVKGACETIRNHRPRLQIAAYHRNEDLFALPEKILEINPRYKLYFRHFPSLPAWELNFYFV